MGSSANAEERFQTLYRATLGPVYQYFLRRADPDIAQDLTADTFLVAWRRLDQVPADRPLPWLYGVGRNVLRNHRRSQRRTRDLFLKLGWLRQDTTAEPDTIVVRRYADQELLNALDRLRPSDQELLRLVIWEELPYDEIGRILRCSANAVAQRRSRAIQELTKELKAIGHKGMQARHAVKGEVE